MEYNLFLTNTQPYEVIGYNGNGSRGLVRYAVDWVAFLKNDCPYILTIVLRTRRIERQNGDFLVRATGFLGENFQSGITTSKQSSQVIGIIKNYNGSKNIGGVLTTYISYKNGFSTYLQKRPASPFFEIEILTMEGQPIDVTPFPFEYILIMNFKEVNFSLQKTINPKRHQITFYSKNATNAPLQFVGTIALFNVDWSFLDDRPYLMTFQFYTSTLTGGNATGLLVQHCNIPTLNSISNFQFTGTKIMNQNTGFIGISRRRSYQNDGDGFFTSEIDDNPPSTILSRPKSNILQFYSAASNLQIPSQSILDYRFILFFTEL